MKIRPVRSEFLHTDGRKDRRTERQTDVARLIKASRNFAKAPKKHNVSVHAIKSYGNLEVQLYTFLIQK